MKRVFAFLAISIFLTSCSPEETNYYSQVAAVDAAATDNFIMEHGGYGMVILDQYFTLGAFSNAAAMVGAAASRGWQGRSPLPSNRSTIRPDYILPEQYVNVKNPYECVGFAHNRILQEIRIKNIQDDQILSMDSSVVKPLIRLYAICDAETDVDSIYKILKNNNFKQKFESINQDYYNQNNLTTILNDKAMTDTSGHATYMLKYIRHLQTDFPDEDYVQIINDINLEIKKQLSVTKTSPWYNTKLAFLSVLKHSTYYWR
jgi:hypothetical protein